MRPILIFIRPLNNLNISIATYKQFTPLYVQIQVSDSQPYHSSVKNWEILISFFFYFDPIINLIFALLSWLDLKLKFSGYRILNRWLSYNSQTQVASTVFLKKTVFFISQRDIALFLQELYQCRIIVSVLHMKGVI